MLNSAFLLADEFTFLVPMMGIFLIAITMINYYKAAFTEPGFLPRGSPQETDFLEKKHDIITDLNDQYFPVPKSICSVVNKCDYHQNFCVRVNFFILH